jgi:hypothetical protein
MSKLIANIEQIDHRIAAAFNRKRVFIGTITLLVVLSVAARVWLVHTKADLHKDEIYSFVIAVSGRELSADFLKDRTGH